MIWTTPPSSPSSQDYQVAPDVGCLDGKSALITGASQGLGRTLALRYAAEGATVVVASRNLQSLAGVVEASGGRCMAMPLDVTVERQCMLTVEACLDKLGKLDILVNNAGIAPTAEFADLDTATWRAVMAVNVDAPFWLTRAALPQMLRRSAGAVISIASVASKVGFRYASAYCASKHALLGLTRALAVEYATSGVTFNCICPYYLDTPMTHRAIDHIAAITDRSRDEIRGAFPSPQGRLIDPGEVAAICVLLASEEGRAITGQGIEVDGGRHQG